MKRFISSARVASSAANHRTPTVRSQMGDGKLLASQSTEKVDLTDETAESNCESAQNLIPGKVTMPVVDQLEVVGIDHQYR